MPKRQPPAARALLLHWSNISWLWTVSYVQYTNPQIFYYIHKVNQDHCQTAHSAILWSSPISHCTVHTQPSVYTVQGFVGSLEQAPESCGHLDALWSANTSVKWEPNRGECDHNMVKYWSNLYALWPANTSVKWEPNRGECDHNMVKYWSNL